MIYFCIANKRRKDVILLLKQRGYPSDPVKAWKAAVDKDHIESDGEDDSNNESQDDQGMDYDYLVGLSGWYLTLEKKEELLKQRDGKVCVCVCVRVRVCVCVRAFVRAYIHVVV